MKYKQFEKLGNEKLSVVGIGTWALGGNWNNVEDKVSKKAIETAIDCGINFIDTAPIYGMGHSEEIVGKAIKKIDRSKLFIATKCGLTWDNKKIRKNLRKESIYKEIDNSLERLQTDYIDIYQVHWPDPNTGIKETMHTLNKLKKEGKIRYIGVSNYSLEMLKKAEKYSKISAFQGLYNMFEHNPELFHNIKLGYKSKDEILPYCEKDGIAFLPYSPLMQGLLSGKFKESGNFDNEDDRRSNKNLKGERFEKYYKIALELKEISNNIGKPLYQLAINWLINQKNIGPVIAGIRTPEHAIGNADSANWRITNDVKKEIDEKLKNITMIT